MCHPRKNWNVLFLEKNSFMSMVNNSLSPADLSSVSIMNESDNLSQLIAGPIVAGNRFIDVAKAYGLKNTLRSFYGRFLYMQRLWRLRYLAIMIILCENYEKIPKGSPSRFLTGIFVRSARMKRLLYRSESVLRNKIILNPYQVKTMANEEPEMRSMDNSRSI